MFFFVVKIKENKCTIHRKIIKSLAVEFKESLSQKESVISDLVSEIYEELDSDGHHIPKTDEIMTNASGMVNESQTWRKKYNNQSNCQTVTIELFLADFFWSTKVKLESKL